MRRAICQDALRGRQYAMPAFEDRPTEEEMRAGLAQNASLWSAQARQARAEVLRWAGR